MLTSRSVCLRNIHCVWSGWWVNEVLSRLDGDFAKAYASGGRPSIAPERLLRALLLQAFYTIRSERQLMEQLDYNLLYRWFVGLGVDEAVWVPTVFTKNRDRLLEADVARKFLAELMDHQGAARAVVGRALLGRRQAADARQTSGRAGL